VTIHSGLTGDERVIVNPPDAVIGGAVVRIGKSAPRSSKPASERKTSS